MGLKVVEHDCQLPTTNNAVISAVVFKIKIIKIKVLKIGMKSAISSEIVRYLQTKKSAQAPRAVHHGVLISTRAVALTINYKP